ncbi:MAG: hypothetical protein AB2784_01765 [Candidatus Thiodiazotropha endolucinida]
MKNRFMLLGFILVILFFSGDALADKAPTQVKAELQAVMQKYIMSNSINDQILDLDLSTGDIRILSPAAAHPMIFLLGDIYVMCSDLRTKHGESVPVDFYVSIDDSRYKIFRMEIGNRKPLEILMKQGIVRKME